MNIKQWFEEQEKTVIGVLNSPAEEVFTPAFMKFHTKFKSIADFYEEYLFHSTETLISIDQFVQNNTDFSTWENMQGAAVSGKLNGFRE